MLETTTVWQGKRWRAADRNLEKKGVEEAFLTDEDRMIASLQLHRDTADLICSTLSDHGIKYELTRGNSPLGDILIIILKTLRKRKQF